MKILFVAPRFHTNQYEIVKTLLKQKHKVFFHVAVLGPTEDYSLITPENYKQSTLSLIINKIFGKGEVNKPYYFPQIFKYWRSLKAIQPDFVIIRDPNKNFFSILATLYSWLLNAKIIFYSQEELYRTRNRTTILKKNLFIAFFKAAWMTPILGNRDKKDIKINHMYYVPIPVHCKSVQQTKDGILTEIPKLLMIGKYHQERKKHLLLVKAINNLKKTYDLKATFIGECVTPLQQDNYEFLANTIKELSLSDTIQLLKNVPFSEMEHLYSTHHIFVLPAVNEQYGVSVTEALGYGLPAICTDTCGARYNILQGENGYIIKSNSLEELTSVIESLISNKHRIMTMRKKSIEYAHLNLSEHAFYSKFTHLVKTRFNINSMNQY